MALSILMVGFLGIVALLSSSLGLNRRIANTYTANYLAMEGIEVVKNLIDANHIQGYSWNCGFPAGGDFEVSYYDTATVPCPGAALRPVGSASSYLLFDSSNNTYNDPKSPGATGVPTFFKRVITIGTSGSASTTVASKVTWLAQGGRTESVEIDDVFWNWRQ